MLNIIVWGSNQNQKFSLLVLLISLVGYYILGFFLKPKNSTLKSMQTVIAIPILSNFLYLGVLFPNSDFDGSFINGFEFLYFVSIQPFLYITGIPADFDHPFIFAIVPALMLWLGLQSKVLIRNK
jgi:hypothetical protein